AANGLRCTPMCPCSAAGPGLGQFLLESHAKVADHDPLADAAMRIALAVSLVAGLGLFPAFGAAQQPAPAASAELSGSVVDERGRPVAGAQVRVAPFANGHG